MADTAASGRGGAYGERRAGVAWAAVLALSSASCADLLDLPSDPHLAEATSEPETEGEGSPARGEEARRQGPGPEPLVATGTGGTGTGVGEAVVMPGALEASAPTDSGGFAGAQSSAAADAGASSTAPDAGLDEPAPNPDEPPAPCAAPASVGPDGRCYLVVEQTLAWDDARLGCQGRGDGWDLAAIRSQVINDFIGQLTDAEAWLGGSDAAVEGTWRWVSDGAAFWSGDGTTGVPLEGAFEVWNTDEPNGRGNSDCARTVPIARTGRPLTWADLECFELRASLCEGPPL